MRRKPFTIVGLSAILLLFIIGSVSASTIDAPAALNQRLSERGAVRKQGVRREQRRVCNTGCCGKECAADCTRCHMEDVDVPFTLMAPLTVAGGLSVVRLSDVVFGTPVVNSLPEQMHSVALLEKNCSAISVTRSQSLSVSVTASRSLTVSRAVSTGQSISANASFGMSGVGSAGVSVSFSTQVTVSESKTDTRSETITRSDNVSLVAPPMTEAVHYLHVIESNVKVPFTAQIVVDAPVDANLDGYGSVSQVLPEAARTFVAEGYLEMTTASDGNGVTKTRSLSQAADCASGTGVDVETFQGSRQPLGLLNGKATDVRLVSSGDVLRLSERVLSKVEGESTARLQSVLTAGHQRSLGEPSTGAKLRALGKLDPTAESYPADTSAFVASGSQQCQSATDIGHSCDVFGSGYDDCNEAFFALKSDDCCPATRVCSVDPATGDLQCRYGGTSIGFTMGFCLPN